jgi:hypothetical protein
MEAFLKPRFLFMENCRFSCVFFMPLEIVETVLKSILIWFQRFQCGLPWFTPPLSRPPHRFGQIIF